ncbi:unnamed protein product [Clavelina lepadiformis]|uniref:Organic solute transporter subunit alpha n=2 Tax=Clavelina lepadiformis TaxID=159417 RepID=A0ABP0FLJ1_CLALP
MQLSSQLKNVDNLDNCTYDRPPNITALFKDITKKQVILLSVCGFLFIVTAVVFVLDSIFIRRRQSKFQRYFWHLLYIQGTYIIYSAVSMISLISPTSSLLAELVFSIYIAFTLKELMSLILRITKMELNSNDMPEESVSLAVTPIACCCCCICPNIKVNKKLLLFVKCGIYQATILRPLLTFVQAVLWTNGYFSTSAGFKLVELLNGFSVITAMYFLALLYSSFQKLLSQYQIQVRFVGIQLVMLIVSVQQNLLGLLAQKNIIRCEDPFNSVVRATEFHHTLVVGEMLLILLCSCLIQRRKNDVFLFTNEERSPLLHEFS